MKQRLVILGCVIVTMLLLVCSSEYVKINAKIKKYEKPLRQEWLGKDRHTYEFIAIQKEQYYTLQDFLRVYRTKYKSAEELLIQIKNNGNVACSGKGLKIRKHKFMAKKEGEYKLKIKTENKFHVFSLRVVEPFYQMQLDRVSKILLSQKTLGKTTMMEVTDPNKVNGIKSKLMQTKYAFDFTKTLKKRAGFGGYYVALYDTSDHLIQHFSITSNTISEYGAMWMSDSDFASECFDQIDNVYKDALALVPKRVW